MQENGIFKKPKEKQTNKLYIYKNSQISRDNILKNKVK